MGAERDLTSWIAAGMITTTLIAISPSIAKEADGRDPFTTPAVMPGSYQLPRLVAAPPAPAQPIAFSHARHVGTLALQCATCHLGAGPAGDMDERPMHGKHMTLPATQICMSCHVAIATDRPGIQALAKYHAAKEDVPWVRVYRVLNGVNWTHQPHIGAGIKCQTCHGEVAKMDVMAMATPVAAMATCFGCHRATRAKSQCETCHAWPSPADFRRWSP